MSFIERERCCLSEVLLQLDIAVRTCGCDLKMDVLL